MSDCYRLVINIHPVFRVLCFLLVAIFLSFSGVWAQILTASILFFLYVFVFTRYIASAFKTVMRLRWFYLSIAVIYFWMTPGSAVWLPSNPTFVHWMPTYEGIVSGLFRISALMLIVLSVNLLISASSREQLLMAIQWLAKPLELLSISSDRLAIRIILIFEALPAIQSLLGEQLAILRGQRFTLSQVGVISAGLFAKVITKAEQAVCHDIAIPRVNTPPWHQWFYPLVLMMVYWMPESLFF